MQHAFPCGTLVLDFVGTLRTRRAETPLEMLGSPESLDAWYEESGLARVTPNNTQADLKRAVSLREAVHSLVAAHLTHKPLPPTAVNLVNKTARTPPAIPQLTLTGRRLEATPSQALSTLARQAVDILGGPEAELLKECGRPECTQIYLDHSRGSRREWCAMTTCGNRMKAAAYRSRKREHTR